MIHSLQQKLNSLGIAADEIIVSCCTDLDFDGNYRFAFLVLTEQSVILLRNAQPFFDLQAAPVCDHNAEVITYRRADCRDFRCDYNVSGLTLSMMYRDSAVMLATATNRFSDDVRIFAHAAEYGVVLPKKERGGSGAKSAEAPSDTVKRPHVLLRMLEFYRPYRKRVFGIFLFVFLCAVIDILTPYLSGDVLFGQVFGDKSGTLGAVLGLTGVVVVLLLTKVISQLMYALQAYITAKITPFVMRDLKAAIFKKMSGLSIGFYHSRETGTLMTRVLDDANHVSHLLIDHMPYLIMDIFTITTVAVIMFILDWRLAIAALILMPLSVTFAMFMMSRLFHLHGRQHRAHRRLYSHLNDNLTGSRVVRAFGREENEVEHFDSYSTGVKATEMDLVKTENRIFAMFELVRDSATLLIYLFGAYVILTASGTFSYATLITFAGYTAMLSGPLDNLAHMFRIYSNFTNASQRIFEILDAEPQVKESDHPQYLPHPKGEVELKNVSFSYDTGKPVLQNVSFTAPAGKLLGIVGYSGAGKTTLLNLIARLYDPDSGTIAIDGIPIDQIAFDDLRRMIAVVSQETYIFMGTVAENIAYAHPEATRKEIVHAAMAASAHDFIMKMPDGYDTVIGASGRELSGGERQRLSIARAILADPKILILDEATASVDTKTEVAIQQSLEQLIQNRTTISVAHRLSTLRNADHLVVIDNGRLIESGTHEQLMKKQGLYYELATLQTQQMIMKGEDCYDRNPDSPIDPR